MRPQYVSLNAVGNTPWVPVSHLQWAFGVGIAVTFSTGAALTYTVQHTYDPIDDSQLRDISASQTTTVITVTGDLGPPGSSPPGLSLGHGLIVGDDYIIRGTVGMDGEYTVATVPSATSVTLTDPVSQSIAAQAGKAKSYRIFNNATLAAQTARGSTNYTTPVTAVRLNVSLYTSGVVTMAVVQGLGS